MNESMLNNCFVKIIMICVLFYREMEGGSTKVTFHSLCYWHHYIIPIAKLSKDLVKYTHLPLTYARTIEVFQLK